MEFTILKTPLLEALNLSLGVVDRRNTIPILGHVLVESTESGISMAATDQEIGIRWRCAATVRTPGALTTGARKLYEIVRELPPGEITIRALDNHWVEVVADKARFRLAGLDPREFPAMPAAEDSTGSAKMTLPPRLLGEMLERTTFAVSKDDMRLNLSGVFVERSEEDRLRMVATDGHRLSLVSRAVAGGGTGPGVILPRKGMAEIQKVLDLGDEEVEFRLGSGVVSLSRDNVDLTMRLVEGEFPDYRQVLPKKTERRAVVDVVAFQSALRRVSLMSAEGTHGVKLAIEPGRIEITSTNPTIGEARDEVSAEYDGPSFAISFNSAYLIDVLTALGGAGMVELGFQDEVSSGVIRVPDDPDFLYVVMPMRL